MSRTVFARPYVAVAFSLLATACGETSQGTNNAFVSTAKLVEPEHALAPGDLEVVVENRLPTVDAVAPNSPTVFHLNLHLTLVDDSETEEGDSETREDTAGQNGNDRNRSDYKSRYYQMQGTLHHTERHRWTFTAAQLRNILGTTPTKVKVEMVSSGAVASWYWGCQQKAGEVVYRQDQVNELKFQVVRRHQTSFDCTPLTANEG